MGGRRARSYSPRTVKTYAVKWREPDGQTFIGRLALGPLHAPPRRAPAWGGGASGQPAVRLRGASGLRIGSRGAERLDGRPALVVERPDGAYLVADAGMGAPIVQELVERLAGSPQP